MTGKTQRVRRRATVRRGPRDSLIPPEFDRLLNRFSTETHERREVWWYLLVLMMIDQEQVRFMREHELAGRRWVTVQTRDGDEFEIVKPEAVQDRELELLVGAREIWARVTGAG